MFLINFADIKSVVCNYCVHPADTLLIGNFLVHLYWHCISMCVVYVCVCVCGMCVCGMCVSGMCACVCVWCV